MSTGTPSNRKWKIALVAALVTGPLLGALGSAWAAQTFPDVPPTHTFYEEIEWGVANGIVNGFNDGTFRPGQPVTRGASVAFLSHYNDAIHEVSSTVNPAAASSFNHSADCPVGDRPISGRGSTSSSNVFLTDESVAGRTYFVRWETDDSAILDPTSLNVTVVCAPAPVGNAPVGAGSPSIDKPPE